MKIIATRTNGEPSAVELTDLEMLVSEIHSNLMDLGFCQGDAVVMLRGSAIPEGLQQEQPVLDRVLDPLFVAWLTT